MIEKPVKFARVPKIPGVVREVYLGNEMFPVHPDFACTWYPCPIEVEEFWIFDGEEFAEPVPVVHIERKAVALPDPMDIKLNAVKAEMAKHEESTAADLQRFRQEMADLQAAIIDTKGAIYAIKGFMMEIPNIQKQLVEIQEKLK